MLRYVTNFRRFQIKLFSKKASKIEVAVAGGLGNQLFMFFAAYSHAIKFSKKLIIDLSEINSPMYPHKSSIKSFLFTSDFQSSIISKNSFINKQIVRLCRRNSVIKLIYFYFTGNYSASGLGYDAFLDSNSNIKRVSGYFQSYVYIESLINRNVFLSLQLREKSEWFQKLSSEIAFKQVISVHFRRGDYLNEQTSIGLLSREYYEKSVSYLQKLLPESELWVFSDDIVEAKKCLDGFSTLNITWIVPPHSVDPAESMLLMSYSAGIVTANSSFSWWAAATGNRNKQIVAPSPWFKTINEPQLLIPNGWHRIESSWQ